VIGLYKNEAIRSDSPLRNGPPRTVTDVETITMDYVDWYNNHRLHSRQDNLTPEEYEQAYYAPPAGPPPGDAASKKTA
jgi:putative transposase